MIEVTEVRPIKGLVIFSWFDSQTELSRISIFNLYTCRYEFQGLWSGFSSYDSEPVLFGIEEACKFAVANNYKGKIYVSDAIAMSWGRGYHRYTGSFNSLRMDQIFDTLKQHKFGRRIWLWSPWWGKIEDHIELVLAREAVARKFFCS